MDIAVRAHLHGWKVIFLNDETVLCELPKTYEAYKKPDCSVFRVYNGVLQIGQTVKCAGRRLFPEDEEAMTIKEVTKLWVYQSRNRIPISRAPPGSWVLIEDVDASILKTATICNVDYDDV